MISCPAAKQMRCVNPSIATASPSRTRDAIASRIDATLVVVIGRSARRLDLVERTGRGDLGADLGLVAGNLGDGLRKDPDRGFPLVGRHRQRWRQANRRTPALEH